MNARCSGWNPSGSGSIEGGWNAGGSEDGSSSSGAGGGWLNL
jgi:hypothetical protein